MSNKARGFHNMQLSLIIIMEQQTQSKRLRNVLFLLWKQEPEGFSVFEFYYQAKTEIIIQHFKSKLKQ